MFPFLSDLVKSSNISNTSLKNKLHELSVVNLLNENTVQVGFSNESKQSNH